jgi:hypothetical protein
VNRSGTEREGFDDVRTMTIVGDEMLRRRALEHRARWEAERRAQARAEEEARANEAAARRLAEEGTRNRTDGTTAGGAHGEGEEEEDERQCRICFTGEESGRLFSPCRCRGSVRWVHVRCLNNWRTMSANPRAFYQCNQCGYEYNLERTRAAKWLEREELALAIAVIGVALLTVFTGCACRLLSRGLVRAASLVERFVAAHPRVRTPRAMRALRDLTSVSVETHPGVRLHVSPLYVEVFFYRLTRWVPPWRDARRIVAARGSWFHASSIVQWHETFDLLTGGYLAVALIAFTISLHQNARLLGARRFAEYAGPSLALVFIAHGSRGLRLPLFAGSIYAYARLHDYAKRQSRDLLTRIGQRVLDVR